MQIIDFQQMNDIETHASATIINVLPAEYFEKTHIPGSINIPFDSEDFPQRVKTIVGGTDAPIVVYCASEACNKSKKAGPELIAYGFSNVMCYEGGTKEWQDRTAHHSSAA